MHVRFTYYRLLSSGFYGFTSPYTGHMHLLEMVLMWNIHFLWWMMLFFEYIYIKIIEIDIKILIYYNFESVSNTRR